MRTRLRHLLGEIMRGEIPLLKREEGQALLEYAIVIAVAVLVVLASIKGFGTTLGNLFNNLISQVTAI